MTHEAPSVTPSTGLPPSTGGAPSTEVEGRSRVPRRWAAGLRLMTPSGRARVPVAWALYDMANTVFSFAVVSVAMGLWLTRPERLGPTEGQVALGLVVALSVLINALVSPILGALSDRAGRRLPFLLFFTALCVVPTVFIGPSPAIVGLALFALANFAFQAALIYYDALLPLVSRPESRGRLSGIGVAVGYLGTITVGVLLVTLDVSLEGTFVVAGALFAALAVPIFVVVREGRSVARRDSTGVSWAQLRHTIRAAREIPGLLRFLVARFFYTDPINTVIVVMAVFAVQAIGLSESAARAFLLFLAVVAVVASLGWGVLVDRLGPRRTLLLVLASWCVGLAIVGLSLSPAAFVVAGAVLGSGLGGVQVADRVFLLRLAPADRVGEFFGLYGLIGKLSAVTGPLLYGVIVGVLLEPLGRTAYQLGILSLLILMVIGIWLVRSVSDRPSVPVTAGVAPVGAN